ncbi:RagB/SusD family nutrient uptake outer membrane protein [Sinomicrobium weinanense]|uniref:RagB/SusD family nutrient uptake outer membrane protein n=1 Tax=Sinomicrobium weinanense TaxID=2842200 RepID=A0A926Q4Z9_9FLAO|nr:RagB/SusD family nutrient uptake outer membrane protein [Sinomicrobium weinanense]MBC9797425.1 RagB/SusD family nutrient uptake outer membrane protein [Sinomicrobium weinanense]MBU3123081.1 RagB/SusD family nutrient uptake outer membrane protein [Sinomicrobium weinanense]
MRKRIRIPVLYILIGMAMTSCMKDDFLERLPESDLSEPTFFKNEADLKLYVNRFYTVLPVAHPANDDNRSDNHVPSNINTFLGGTYVVPVASGGEDWNWENIRAVNYFLQRYQRAEESDEIKARYAAEAKFFRALFYWNMVKKYGDIPWLSKDLDETSEELYDTKLPHKQVMDSVLADLNFSVDHLPLAGGAARGRLHRDAAAALKSRICLWEGTYRKYHGLGDEAGFLREAAEASELVMNSGNYDIYSTGNPEKDYYELFIQEELEGNPETIMAKRYIQDELMHNVTRQLGESGTGFSKSFVRSFLCTDGLPASLSPLYQEDDSIQAEIADRDPRFKQLIATPGFVFQVGTDGTPDVIGLPRIGTSVTTTGYQIIKGRSPDIAQWNANRSTLDRFIFRYAEVLLNYAEAKAELGEADQLVLDNTINKIRQRVDMPPMVMGQLRKDPESPFPDLPVLIDEIRRERRIELAAEGMRFDDLQRWKAGELINDPESILGMKLHPDVKAQYDPGQISGIVLDENGYIRVYPGVNHREWDDKMYLYPIPTQELTLNPALEPQNPGW